MKKASKKPIKVGVIKHLPLGLSVELENGQRGIVRIREISWNDEKRADWKKNHPPGWKGLAVPLFSEDDEVLELSLRLAENDPWKELIQQGQLQKAFVGVVVGMIGYGAFIEIAPGVSGLLHRSQLPDWVKDEPTNLFWPGDKVKVTIREVDYEQRRISLGFLFSQTPDELKNSKSNLKKDELLRHDANLFLTEFLKKGTHRKHILVVEDEPEQRAALTNWLHRVGQRVDTASSAEKALAFLEKNQPDIAILDVGLPKMDGIQLAEIILERWPSVRVINATDWARADEMAEALERIQTRGVDLLIKPLLPEDIIRILEDRPGETPAPTTDIHEAKPTLPEISGSKKSQKIKTLLSDFRVLLGFEQVILFMLDPTQRLVSVSEQSGGVPLVKKAFPALIFSPVRDVAEDRKVIFASEILPQEKERFHYLTELFPNMVSCIGVPIPAQTSANYAFFAIDKNFRSIGNEQRIYAKSLALALGAVLEQYAFQERSILMQRAALIGQLTRALVHEINNLIAPLASRLGNLQEKLSRLEKNSSSPELQEQRNKLVENELLEFQAYIRKIISTTRMFGHIASKEKNEALRVDEIISETIFLLRDTGNRLHVSLFFSPPTEFLVIQNQGAVLEQVLLNIILNAIQQVSELRPETGGWVKISAQSHPTRQSCISILVEDNGPGVHISLWEKIFEVGFTTRREGSGIGLYISRTLMEQMSGRVYIQDSQILGGTIFALEIPR